MITLPYRGQPLLAKAQVNYMKTKKKKSKQLSPDDYLSEWYGPDYGSAK